MENYKNLTNEDKKILSIKRLKKLDYEFIEKYKNSVTRIKTKCLKCGKIVNLVPADVRKDTHGCKCRYLPQKTKLSIEEIKKDCVKTNLNY